MFYNYNKENISVQCQELQYTHCRQRFSLEHLELTYIKYNQPSLGIIENGIVKCGVAVFEFFLK